MSDKQMMTEQGFVTKSGDKDEDYCVNGEFKGMYKFTFTFKNEARADLIFMQMRSELDRITNTAYNKQKKARVENSS